jgi:hypothetical protein
MPQGWTLTADVLCQVCARPVADQAYLCSGCTGSLTAALRDVAWLAGELLTTEVRLARMSDGSGSRSAETPLPMNWSAMVDGEALRDTLAIWVRTVAEQRGVTVDADNNAPSLARWMLRYTESIRQCDEAQQLYDEVTHVVREAKKTIDYAATKARFYVGPCPERPEDQACTGEVWAVIPAGENAPATLHCLDCEAEWNSTQWLRVGRRMQQLERVRDRMYGEFVTIPDAAYMARVSTRTVYRWMADRSLSVVVVQSRNRGRVLTMVHSLQIALLAEKQTPEQRTRDFLLARWIAGQQAKRPNETAC